MGIFKNIDRQIKIEVDGQIFTGTLPLPSDERNILVNVSRRIGGTDLKSIPEELYFMERAICTLNYCLDVDEDWGNNPDLDLTFKVFNEFRIKQSELQERLKKNNNSGGNKGTTTGPGNDTQPVLVQEIPTKAKKQFTA